MAGARQGKGQQSQRVAQARVRASKALDLRVMGATYDQIAEQLGYNSHQAAAKAIGSALDRLEKEPAEKVRKLELRRLDRMQRVLAVRVMEGDEKAHDRWLAIMAHRARLLGLAAPVKAEIVADVKANVQAEFKLDPAFTAEVVRIAKEAGIEVTIGADSTGAGGDSV